MKIVLASLGTAGDVHPFIAIGQHLAGRGHRVELISNPVFAELAQAAGIEFHGVGSAADFREAFDHPLVWDPIKGVGVIWRYLTRRALQASYERIAALHAEQGCIVVYSPFFMPAARIAAEALGLRSISACTAPAMIRSSQAPLAIAQWQLPRGTPRAVGRLAWGLLDRLKLQPLALPDLQRLREPLGLPPIEQSVFGRWIHSPYRGIALFPAWFAAPAPDWPDNIVQTGFPLYDADRSQGLSAEVARFLNSGEPPLVVTPGSAMRHAQAFLQAAIETSRQTGRRVVLVSQQAPAVPAELSANVIHTTYEPFGLLLPRASALIHHGGIGTSAQALRAGLPQLVQPQAYDQFDNALRLQQLGVAAQLESAEAGLRNMPARLQQLLGDPAVVAHCAEAARRIANEPALPAIQHVIEDALCNPPTRNARSP